MRSAVPQAMEEDTAFLPEVEDNKAVLPVVEEDKAVLPVVEGNIAFLPIVEERVDGGRVREVDHHVLRANVAVLQHVYMISGTTNFRLIILM
jgi:hypothetical protein